MLQVFEPDKLAPLEFHASALNGFDLVRLRINHRDSADAIPQRHILAQRFTHELGAGAMLLLPNTIEFVHHGRRKRDSQCLAGSLGHNG